MSNLIYMSGDEDPIDLSELRELRQKFEAIVAPYIGDAMFSPTRVKSELAVDSIFVAIDLPEDTA